MVRGSAVNSSRLERFVFLIIQRVVWYARAAKTIFVFLQRHVRVPLMVTLKVFDTDVTHNKIRGNMKLIIVS
jgi:hypothetical protein